MQDLVEPATASTVQGARRLSVVVDPNRAENFRDRVDSDPLAVLRDLRLHGAAQPPAPRPPLVHVAEVAADLHRPKAPRRGAVLSSALAPVPAAAAAALRVDVRLLAVAKERQKLIRFEGLAAKAHQTRLDLKRVLGHAHEDKLILDAWHDLEKAAASQAQDAGRAHAERIDELRAEVHRLLLVHGPAPSPAALAVLSADLRKDLENLRQEATDALRATYVAAVPSERDRLFRQTRTRLLLSRLVPHANASVKFLRASNIQGKPRREAPLERRVFDMAIDGQIHPWGGQHKSFVDQRGRHWQVLYLKSRKTDERCFIAHLPATDDRRAASIALILSAGTGIEHNVQDYDRRLKTAIDDLVRSSP